MSNADSRRGRDAMKKLEFAVAADLFMTPTAELCDYVLPATSFLEMANITTAFEHRRQGKPICNIARLSIEPLAERRSDTWIIFELAKRLGFGDKFLEWRYRCCLCLRVATERRHIRAAQKLTGGHFFAGRTSL